MGGIWRNVRQRIVSVYETPILGWRAVICERVELLERGGVGIEPLASAAVQVLDSWLVLRDNLHYSTMGEGPYPVIIVPK